MFDVEDHIHTDSINSVVYTESRERQYEGHYQVKHNTSM